MKIYEFEMLKRNFREADVESKIDIYKSAKDLTSEQYGQLLRLFPLNKLKDLENALK